MWQEGEVFSWRAGDVSSPSSASERPAIGEVCISYECWGMALRKRSIA
jgi:hypothetical protein